jgi:hypothetical protein
MGAGGVLAPASWRRTASASTSGRIARRPSGGAPRRLPTCPPYRAAETGPTTSWSALTATEPVYEAEDSDIDEELSEVDLPGGDTLAAELKRLLRDHDS